MSSGRPNRPVGLRARRSAFASGSVSSQLVSSGVSIGPGQIALVRIALRRELDRQRPGQRDHGAFEAVYASWGTLHPTSATNDAMLTIEPPPARCIAGMPYLQAR